MSQRIVIEALVRTTAWGVAHRLRQLRTLGGRIGAKPDGPQAVGDRR